ncbi:MAG: tRNA 4-thiouridine(8) synthase ThiI [Caldithrix sp.]|nr:tRNA 4-thiouridine(8) synthase ThiI [Caldithrix sp.]
MKKLYLCHYSEIGLKGANRHVFERKLVENIKFSLNRTIPHSRVTVKVWRKRVLVQIPENIDHTLIEEALGNVFGIVNYSLAYVVQSDLQIITQTCVDILDSYAFESFAIHTKRSDKTFHLKSYEVNKIVGSAVVEAFHKKVRLTEPDVQCVIEIIDDRTYIYVNKKLGLMGLPVGSNARVLSLLSAGIDSPVAAYYVMKRGSKCHFLHFHSHPFTSRASQDKVLDLARQLNRFQYQSKVYMVPFTESQQEIVLNCPDRFRLLLFRRFMMRIAERLALKKKCKAVVTGDSLGQVASQTVENLSAIEAVIRMPVLRPLIGLDKSEIMEKARTIGSYDISNRPHDDVCTRFMPKHPEIKARLQDVEKAEHNLAVEEMVKRDVENVEIIKI